MSLPSRPSESHARRNTDFGSARPRSARGGPAANHRFIGLHNGLSSGRVTTAAKLAAHLEPPPRTIKRDIERLRDNHGAPIEWDANERLAFLYIARGSAGEVRSMLCFFERRSALRDRNSQISNPNSTAERCSPEPQA